MSKIKAFIIRYIMVFMALSAVSAATAQFIAVTPMGMLLTQFIHTIPVALGSLIKPTLGNYKVETQVVDITRKSLDPNPDREYMTVTNKSGHSFPLRAVILGIIIIAIPVLMFILPVPMYSQLNTGERAIPELIMVIMSFTTAFDFLQEDSKFTDVAGCAIGIILHSVCAVMLTLVPVPNSLSRVYATVLSCTYVLCCLLICNSYSLYRSTGYASGKPQKAIRIKNKIITVALYACVLLMTFADKIRELFEAVTGFFVMLAFKVLEFMGNLMGNEGSNMGEGTGTGELDLSYLDDGIEARPTPQWVIVMMRVIAILALAVLVGFVLYKLFKKLKQLFARLNTDAEMGGYTDETEEIRPDDNTSGTLASAIKSIFTVKKPWSSLSPKEKVRRVYLTCLKKNRIADNALTSTQAVELFKNAPQDKNGFRDLYDAARYSEHIITDEDAENARQLFKL